MSSLLKLDKPKTLNDDIVSAWFTLKNADLLNTTSKIPGLNLGFNTQATSQEIISNRELLSKEIDTPLNQISYAKQVHGAEIEEVIKGGLAGNCDGLITVKPGLALAIQVADCAAILLCDKEEKIVAAIHAGWRGAVNNIVLNAVELMAIKGAKPKNIQVFISPCISKKRFEVGLEVANQFPIEFVDFKSFEKPRVDLKGFITHQLLHLGLTENNIECSADCTITDGELYYSYRREKEKSGRMMAIIKLNE